MKVSPPLLQWNIPQLRQQLVNVVVIARACSGVPGGINARTSIERIDDQSGVIGYRRQARFGRGMSCLDHCIVSECRTGFGNRSNAEFTLWN